MAADGDERRDNDTSTAEARDTQHDSQTNGRAEHSDDDDEEEDEDEERHFKYASLTGRLGSVFRRGDSASASLTSGDKLIIATHGGNVHVLSIPSLSVIRTYRAHKASITSISVCPYKPVFTHGSGFRDEALKEQPQPAGPRGSVKGGPRSGVPQTPSNLIHIATSSLDGTVCVSSLVDEKDVTLRNFGRPVQCVSISPEYQYDRSYVSGGLDGNLIVTSGGQKGVETQANINTIASSASSWLGQIGLSADKGKDAKVHSGEGAISATSWSLSGKYVAWVNEHGIKVARTNLFLHPDHASSAWTVICHVDKPNRKEWDEMGSAWKARAHWIDQKHYDAFDDWSVEPHAAPQKQEASHTPDSPNSTPKKATPKTEQLLVGWGDAVWIVEIDPKGQHLSKPGASPALGKANLLHRLKLDGGTISGLSLFSATTLLVLTQKTRLVDPNATPETPKKSGIRKRQNGLPAEMHLVNLGPGYEELELEEIPVSKYESLSAADYHLSTLYFTAPPTKSVAKQRNAFGQFGDGLWDVGVSATSRIFSSSASVLSGSSDDRTSLSTARGTISSTGSSEARSAFPASYSRPGLKLFLVSAYDCFMGGKRDLSDHMKYLEDHGQFQDVWDLLEAHPETLMLRGQSSDSGVSTPTGPGATLLDFFADDASVSTETMSNNNMQGAALKRERRRIGDSWIKQLVQNGDFARAGEVAEQALDTSDRWEHWISAFAEANKYDAIVPHMPSKRMKPAVSGALYELVLGHYAKDDPRQLRKLVSKWDSNIYDPVPVVSAIQSRSAAIQEQSSGEDVLKNDTWRSLQGCLADLLLVDGRAFDAVQCYIRAGEAESAMQLVRENQLYTAISDDVYAFITMAVPVDERKTMSHSDLEGLTLGPIRLTATGSSQGLVSVNDVVHQLESRGASANFLIYLYFRVMFNGDIEAEDDPNLRSRQGRRPRFGQLPPTNTTRSLLNSCADLVVTLFAEFDPPLLNTLIRTNDASASVDLSGGSLRFTFEHASAVCRARGLTSELVYLLALVGQTRDALHLIVEEMKDVGRAISFAREMSDQALWGDLLEYSLDKPAFIKGLLEEVGGGIGEENDADNSAIDPLTLVRKIPEGLEIKGLKEALSRILKDGEVQTSISEGAARVLRRDVALLLDRLNQSRRRGVLFQPSAAPAPTDDAQAPEPEATEGHKSEKQDVCGLCQKDCVAVLPFDEGDFLFGFACGHLLHVRCVLEAITTTANKRQIDSVLDRLEEARETAATEQDQQSSGLVGPKLSRASMLRDVLGDYSCAQCEARLAVEDATAT